MNPVSVFSLLTALLSLGHLTTGQMSIVKEAIGVEVTMDYLQFKYYNRQYRDSNDSMLFLINITDPSFPDGLKKVWNYQEDVKIITHGWISSETSKAVADVKDAYLDQHDFNIITLDWSYTASTKNYPVPAVMTHQVGKLTAQVLDALVDNGFSQYSRMHMIGHSLGSHVSGAASSHTKEKLARVTGLDPAGPGFQILLGTDMRLDETDAQFVDTIHTAAGSAGFYSPLGQADFYPNAGTPPQPGCVEMSYNVLSTIAGVLNVGCSHMRSYELFTESIRNPKAFRSQRCDNWGSYQSGRCEQDYQYMGEACSPQARGVYYLVTNNKPPYSIVEEIKEDIIDMADSVRSLVGLGNE